MKEWLKILQLWISCVTLSLYKSGSGFHCLHQFYFLSPADTAAKYLAPCDDRQGREPVASDCAIELQRTLLSSAPYAVLLAAHLGADPATGPLFPRSDAASYWIGLHKRNLGTWVTAVHVTSPLDMNEARTESRNEQHAGRCRACIAHIFIRPQGQDKWAQSSGHWNVYSYAAGQELPGLIQLEMSSRYSLNPRIGPYSQTIFERSILGLFY